MQQLDIFGPERLPHRPYCSDDLSFGVYVRPLSTALRMKYLQCNPPHAQYWIVVDIDAPLTLAGSDKPSRQMLAILDGDIPAPNFLAANPENGHAHAYYLLETPVAKGEHASAKALRYCAAIEAALIRALGADACYTGLIAKNPHHPAWRVLELRAEPYTLGELHDSLDLKGPAKSAQRKVAIVEGIRRNCELFDSLRMNAYDMVGEFKAAGTFDQWRRFLADQAEKINTNFVPPLDWREMSHVVKSVATWTWYVYNGRMPDKQFSQLQAKRGARGGRISAKARAEAAGGADLFAEKMAEVRAQRPNLGEPWLEQGISRKTWFRRQAREKLLSAQSSDTLRSHIR